MFMDVRWTYFRPIFDVFWGLHHPMYKNRMYVFNKNYSVKLKLTWCKKNVNLKQQKESNLYTLIRDILSLDITLEMYLCATESFICSCLRLRSYRFSIKLFQVWKYCHFLKQQQKPEINRRFAWYEKKQLIYGFWCQRKGKRSVFSQLRYPHYPVESFVIRSYKKAPGLLS